MVNIKRVLFILAIAITCGAYGSSAQIYVNVRPPRPVVVRTVAPSPAHVWIDEDWRERDGRYEFAGGRWEAPPHPGYHYRQGHWDHSGHGHQWKGGGWHR
jgi:hypothetical protein